MYFITGTDTNIGKTYATLKLLKQFNAEGFKTAALKPVASGAIMTENGLQNEDAQHLQAAASMHFPYESVNPFVYSDPISPHLAAKPNPPTVAEIVSACQPVLSSEYDHLFIEGAGGWFAPINEQETIADLVLAFNCPVLLVVGIKLGCLNHATLTLESLRHHNVDVAGWIANEIDPDMRCIDENIATLERIFSQAPYARLAYERGILNE